MRAELVLKKSSYMYDAGGGFIEVYTDDDGASGYGDNPRAGRWYGTREECNAVSPEVVPLFPVEYSDRPDEFDLACERRHDY